MLCSGRLNQSHLTVQPFKACLVSAGVKPVTVGLLWAAQDHKSSQGVSLLCTAWHFITAYLLCLGCHVRPKSVIVQVAEGLLCLAAPVCRGSSGVWREASVVMAVMDSHRQVALWVTTGTWTHVRLTYGDNKDLRCACVNVFTVSHVFAFLSLSLCLVSQWTLIQKQQWWMLRTQPRRKLKSKQHK